ncbi:lipid A deacylase LpxR family protein [Pedobacter flavus]|uniref:Lipid A deacylase LpxR family protein n=1 Tax=Pedobacter flavus TaxID=3113906 RepID=A0ABU7GXQ4_9SPHI|nr:lipid A deacylase LpxR family protein [Pedobacter sp. VNH31]MEE1883843.1 lipid A deacylase LpxR family protein [Pedobacter sp. VNH31]
MKKLLITFFTFFIIKSSFAQKEDFKNSIGFKSDNDSYLFFGQDQYYTNGVFLSFQHAMDQSNLQKNVVKKTWGFSAAHKMYSPYSGNVKFAKYQDRPFAAYLYGSTNFNWYFKNEAVLKTELQLGVLGESAFGKEAQEFIHELIGFYEINGWQYQIRDMFAINSQIQYQHLITRTDNNKVDLSATGQIDFGNIYQAVGLGLNLRIGLFNQMFQSTFTQSAISNKAITPKFTDKEFYFYYKPFISIRSVDATIQGGHNTNSPVTFGIKPYLFTQTVGLSYNKRRFSIDYAAQFNTKEIKSKAKAHEFGTFTFNYKFN